MTVNRPYLRGQTPFEESTLVTILEPVGTVVYYTTDGSDPTEMSILYTEPFIVTETTTVKAVAIKDGFRSLVSTMTLYKLTHNDDEGSGDME